MTSFFDISAIVGIVQLIMFFIMVLSVLIKREIIGLVASSVILILNIVGLIIEKSYYYNRIFIITMMVFTVSTYAYVIIKDNLQKK